MAVKRYDGSQWVTVAGKGDQGTSSSISTWVKTASGGETSLSGNDDNSQALAYTVGQELVFINGTLLKRGSDYTATNGTSITGLTALAANDVATVWTVNAFSVTGAIANTIVDAKGDLLVGTAADTPGRLAVGTNGQYLKADSTTGTGLAWATLPSSGKVLQVVQGTYSTETDNSTSTYADTGLTVNITPSSTTSKILVMISIPTHKTAENADNSVDLKIFRGATEIVYIAKQYLTQTALRIVGLTSYAYLDSPSSTSSLTYKVQFRNNFNGARARICEANTLATIICIEIGA